MTIDRNEIIERLEHVRAYLNDPVLSQSESQKDALNESLDKCVRYAKYGRYHVTALGVFSTGKSTLLNAMLEDKILPAADVPVTAITTEVYHSEQTSFFIPMENIPAEVLADFRSGVESLDARTQVDIVNSLLRDGETVSGLGGLLREHDSDLIYRILTELTSQQKRSQGPFAALKRLLDENHNLTLWLGVSTLPDWLKDIVLTDAPGTGSIDDSHEIVINKVIPESQLVLYLIESGKTGSALDRQFCNRVSNTYHRKIFYILNKVDQQNADEQEDALASARMSVPEVAKDGETPEFLKAAGLYALAANELAAGRATLDDVLTNPKINSMRVVLSPEWRQADKGDDVSAKRDLLVRFLLQNSHYVALRTRIEEYLRNENKDVAIAYQANDAIARTAELLVHGCDNALRVLSADTTIEELRKRKEQAHELRCTYGREAKDIIKDYQESALDRNTGLGATVLGLLSQVPNDISRRLENDLVDDARYKKLQKKDELRKWLTNELRCCTEDVARKIDNELNKRYTHLLMQLLPILKKIEDESLANTLSSIQVEDTFSTDTSSAKKVSISALSGGALVGASFGVLTAFGIGVSTTVAGTGAAGILAGWGLSSAATMASGLGLGTLTTTTTFFGLSAAGFFIPVIGIGVAAATIGALLFFNNKERKVKLIVDKTKELMDKLVLTGGFIDDNEIKPVAKSMQESVEAAIESSVNDMTQRIQKRLHQMDEEEEKLVLIYNEAAESRRIKSERIEQLKKEIEQIGATAQKALAQTEEKH